MFFAKEFLPANRALRKIKQNYFFQYFLVCYSFGKSTNLNNFWSRFPGRAVFYSKFWRICFLNRIPIFPRLRCSFIPIALRFFFVLAICRIACWIYIVGESREAAVHRFNPDFTRRVALPDPTSSLDGLRDVESGPPNYHAIFFVIS